MPEVWLTGNYPRPRTMGPAIGERGGEEREEEGERTLRLAEMTLVAPFPAQRSKES